MEARMARPAKSESPNEPEARAARPAKAAAKAPKVAPEKAAAKPAGRAKRAPADKASPATKPESKARTTKPRTKGAAKAGAQKAAPKARGALVEDGRRARSPLAPKRGRPAKMVFINVRIKAHTRNRMKVICEATGYSQGELLDQIFEIAGV